MSCGNQGKEVFKRIIHALTTLKRLDCPQNYKFWAWKEAVIGTISRRVFITFPILLYLENQYGFKNPVEMQLFVIAYEVVIAGFFGSIIHDYIVRRLFFKLINSPYFYRKYLIYKTLRKILRVLKKKIIKLHRLVQ